MAKKIKEDSVKELPRFNDAMIASLHENEVHIQAVDQLEEAAKVGFWCEKRPDDDQMLEPLVRLVADPKDGSAETIKLTPWCNVATLSQMVQGCLYLHPLLMKVIKEFQKNAENPEENA